MTNNPNEKNIKNMKNRLHFESKYFDDIDSISDTDNYFLPVLNFVRRFVNFDEARVLDVGCGTGIFLSPLVSWGCNELYGVDGYTDVADRAIQRGYKDVVAVQDLSSSPLPFGDEIFDVVICKDVFEHLVFPDYTLKEITRTLKKGGFFILHVPNHFPLYGRLKFLLTNNLDTFNYFPGATRFNFPHIRFFEHREFLGTCVQNGYSLVKDLSFLFPVVPFINRFVFLQPLVKFAVDRWPNQFAGGFTLVLEKNQ